MAGGKKGCLIFFIVVAAVILLSYPSVKKTHDQLKTLDDEIKASWTKLEGLLQRRIDLVPNYLETVKLYAPHEQEVFGAITKAHLRATTALLRPNKIAANNDLTAALARLRVITERYPELKTDQTIIRLQEELTGIETRIAEECTVYNEAVREYNAYREGFPADIVATFSGFGKAFPVEAPEKDQTHQRSGSDPALPLSDNR